MTSKRDVQLVRLACKWRWLTAEEGEDCLALSHRLGATVAMEEIIRRRGYLDADALRTLGDAADRATAHRRAPRTAGVAPRGEQTVVRAVDFEALRRGDLAAALGHPPAASAPAPVAPTRGARWGGSAAAPPVLRADPGPQILADGTLVSEVPPWLRNQAPTSSEDAEGATLLDSPAATYDEPELPPASRTGDLPAEVTRFEPNPWFARQAAEEAAGADLGAATPDSGTFASADEVQERTVIAPIPQELLQRLREDSRPPRAPSPPPKPVRLAPVVPAIYFPEDEVSETEEPTEDHYEAYPSQPPAAARQATAAFGPGVPALAGAVPIPVSVVGATEPLPRAASGWAEVEPGLEDAPSLLEGDLAEALLGPFGPYELDRIVARGQRSVLYTAHSSDGGPPVAVKVLAGGPAENAVFLDARGDALLAAARLASPHLVRVLDVGRVDARHYVALEYVEGWTLAEKLAFEDAPPAARAFQWASQLAHGLAAAHAAGVYHGDMSPERVLVDSHQHARLTGFGFAPLTARPDDPFAPPEGRGEPSAAADAWGLGAILLATLTGGASPREGIRPQRLPEGAAAALDALLVPDPTHRPTDMWAVAATLAEVAEGLGTTRPEPPPAPPPLAAVAARTGVAAAVLVLVLAAAALGLELGDFGPAWTARLALHGALASAAGLAVATLLLGMLDLIRRGELPLPQSTQWLVQVGEGAGAAGAWCAIAGALLGPLALMNAVVAAVGLAALVSAVFGVVLRRAVARTRPDRGVGRILAVLGDPLVQRWRALHGPMLTVITGLATARFALMAYFSSR